MDLVSFETQQEYDWVKGFIDRNVPFFWTSGRKCNFDGCDKPEFFPKLVNGWFWSANQVNVPPRDGYQFLLPSPLLVSISPNLPSSLLFSSSSPLPPLIHSPPPPPGEDATERR